MKLRIFFLISLFALAACTAEAVEEPAATAVTSTPLGTSPAPTAVPPTPTIVQIAEATAVPTETPPPADEPAPSPQPPTAAPEVEPIVVEYGRTAEGAFFHGAETAPITLIDYSDFL